MGKIALEEIVKKVNKIPAFSETITKLINLMNDPNVEIRELKDLIKEDQGLTTKLLRISNSAFYRGRREVKTVEEAIVLLGLKSVKSMIFAVAVGSVMQKELKGYELKKRELWRQAQLLALISQMIAVKSNFEDRDLAYTAGLICNIGKVVLNEYVGEEIEQIYDLVENSHVPFAEAEEQVLGFNHNQVGGMVAERWNLPEELCEAIKYYRTPDKATINPKLTMICHLADSLLMMMGVHLGVDGLNYIFHEDSIDLLGLDENIALEIMSEATELAKNEETYFDIDF